ncbi:MAG TPA: AgmX/PglI C-terminal domain-containing protein, partial [bacterium]|nr:AgmX/PglI C-terminal domain-containing protein [bacterium]
MKQFDAVLGIIMLLSFLIGGFIVNMIIETPPIEVDIFELDNRFAKLIVGEEQDVKVEELEEEKKVKLEKPKEGLVEASQQRKSLGEEGRVGDKKSRVANAQGSARRGLDAKVAQSSGIMGALSSGAANFDRVFGGGGLGAGMEKTLGSVTGLAGVDQFGSGGLGTRGFGTGGGGNALGIGGLGTRGRGGGGGGKYGMAAGQIGRKGRSDITAGGGQAVIMGALDRSVIDAYIKRNLAKIRWCYEKELNKDPKLFGRIVINFIISGTGTVSSS